MFVEVDLISIKSTQQAGDGQSILTMMVGFVWIARAIKLAHTLQQFALDEGQAIQYVVVVVGELVKNGRQFVYLV